MAPRALKRSLMALKPPENIALKPPENIALAIFSGGLRAKEGGAIYDLRIPNR